LHFSQPSPVKAAWHEHVPSLSRPSLHVPLSEHATVGARMPGQRFEQSAPA
jgi:hypothetical protein